MRVILYISFILLFFQTAIAQVKVIKPVKTHPRKTTLAFGAGAMRSFIFLTRNVQDNNDATGFSGSVVYGGEKTFRGCLEFTTYKKINIVPTWYDIKAYTIELNGQALARFKNTRAYFYPLFGFSFNSFKGYFTGKNDFLNLTGKYEPNQVAKTNWFGVNVGSGYEQYFKRISIFGEYKMRIGRSNKQLTIMDVCFSAGVRFNLRVPSVYSIFSGTKNRYLLESKESED
ncbi:MAG: hypothetical protein JNJ40_18580 [Bacteroidia bacterium]|nr:hypothetical protein [Bacteroidia bacterium]